MRCLGSESLQCVNVGAGAVPLGDANLAEGSMKCGAADTQIKEERDDSDDPTAGGGSSSLVRDLRKRFTTQVAVGGLGLHSSRSWSHCG